MTPREIRATVEGKRRVSTCRFCPEQFENFDQLRFHAQTEHQRIANQVNRSLSAVDAKLRSLQHTADEGMAGHKAGSDHSYEENHELNWETLIEAA